MSWYRRAYGNTREDFLLVARFFQEHSVDFRENSFWSLGRFVDWQYALYEYKRSSDDFWRKNANLYFDKFDSLIGIALSEDGFENIAVIVSKSHKNFLKPIFYDATIERNNRKNTIEFSEIQKREIKIVSDIGYKKIYDIKSFVFDLNKELQEKTILSDDFQIVDMEQCPEYVEQQRLRSEAFEGIAELSREALEERLKFYNNTHRSEIYEPSTDLCVRHREGFHVAGCEALIDFWSGSAEIERICTRSAYRRRGFARAVIVECLHRLRAMGLQRAHIVGVRPEAMALYASLGAREIVRGWGFEGPGDHGSMERGEGKISEKNGETASERD